MEREHIGGTPYWVVGNSDRGYFITFGKWQMTEPEKTLEEALEYYERNEMNIILTTVIILIDDKLSEKNRQ